MLGRYAPARPAAAAARGNSSLEDKGSIIQQAQVPRDGGRHRGASYLDFIWQSRGNLHRDLTPLPAPPCPVSGEAQRRNSTASVASASRVARKAEGIWIQVGAAASWQKEGLAISLA